MRVWCLNVDTEVIANAGYQNRMVSRAQLRETRHKQTEKNILEHCVGSVGQERQSCNGEKEE